MKESGVDWLPKYVYNISHLYVYQSTQWSCCALIEPAWELVISLISAVGEGINMAASD